MATPTSLSNYNVGSQKTFMRIQILDSVAQIESIADEWRQLLEKSASPNPFLTPEYGLAWWQHLGGGEWSSAELRVIVGHDNDNNLVGIAPLFAHEDDKNQTTLMFLGSHEISDFLDIIAKPEDLFEFIASVFAFLSSQDCPTWHILDLYNLLEESATLQQLEEISSKLDWTCEIDKLQAAPLISLPDTWDNYLLNQLSKKQRHELRRKLRKASNHVVPVDWQIVEDEQMIDVTLAALFELMKQDPAKQAFLTEAMQAQITTIAKAAAKHGWLQMAVLTVGNERAAIHLNFDYDNRIWGYNSGVDTRFRELSPGVVLLGNVLEHSIDSGREVFDFMRGDEQYKYRLGAIDRFVYRATIQK
ncbi:MAG: GNAT family N-acetyltransferase [Chloroflexota bacterium]